MSLRWAVLKACPHSAVTLTTKTDSADNPPWRCSPLKHWGSKPEQTQANRAKDISWSRISAIVADKDQRVIGVRGGGSDNLGNPAENESSLRCYDHKLHWFFWSSEVWPLFPVFLHVQTHGNCRLAQIAVQYGWLALFIGFSDERGRGAVNNSIQLFIFPVMVAMPAESRSFLQFNLKQKSLSVVNYF